MKISELKAIIKEEYSNLKEKKGDSTVYIVEGLLVTDTKKRNLEEVLSDIRAITGVTIVKTSEEKSAGEGRHQNHITIKLDPYPFLTQGEKFSDKHLEQMITDIRKIDGVIVYQVIGDPQLKKL